MHNQIKGQVILDVAGTELSAEDREILQHPAVGGFILFTRNFQSHDQLRALNAQVQKIRSDIPIMVDQEGGRVQRFREGFTIMPPMRHWGELYKREPKEAIKGLQMVTETLVTEMQDCGITMTLLPVLDLDLGVSEVIGDRSFGDDPVVVTKLAGVVIDAMHELGMPTTGKHFPGHGGVALDSHVDLPVDSRNWNDISTLDLKPYQALVDRLDYIMTAHVIYDQMDDNLAGFSRFWLQNVLRDKLNYQGKIMSDCLSMEAAAKFGSFADRAVLAFEAGCDLVLVCNNRKGAIEVLDSLV